MAYLDTSGTTEYSCKSLSTFLHMLAQWVIKKDKNSLCSIDNVCSRTVGAQLKRFEVSLEVGGHSGHVLFL